MIKREEVLKRLTAPGAPFEIRTETVPAGTGRGEPMEVYANRQRSLGELVRASAEFGDREYLVTEHSRLSFAEHYAAVAALAVALREEHGVGKGDRVAICSANNPEWIIAFWAAVSIGAIAVGMNSMWAAPEMRFGLSLTTPKVVIADAPRRALIGDAGVPVLSIEEDLPDAFARYAGAALPPDPVEEDDPAVILFTSGTTGRPKGAVHSHRNILAALWFMLLGDAIAAELGAPQAERRFLLVSPLFHIASLHNLAVPRLAVGDTAVIHLGRFDVDRVLRLIESERITNWGAMPTMLSRLVSHEDLEKYDLSSLRAVSVNSAPSSAELKERIRAVLPGHSLGTSYGLTESTTAATIATADELLADPDTVGSPIPTMQVEVRDPDGNPVPEGAEGEIWLRGAQMMLGYWGDLEGSFEPGGWFRTGDLGTFVEGRLRISGRRSDLILRGAENVYPAEVENVLTSHPAVVECAVVGVPHADLGEEVAAIAVVRSGTTEGELTEYASARLGKYKVPTRWLLTTSPLPRNATGKVIRPAAAVLLQK